MEVRIQAQVYSFYEHNVPTYRIWVDDNLYVEREFWPDPIAHFIEELLIVDVDPGKHTITLEKVRPRYREWAWIERVIITKDNNTQDIGLEIKKQDRQVIEFTV